MKKAVRRTEVDIIRLIALVGICVVNIPFMALPTEAVFTPPALWFDKIAAFTVESVFQLKFFLLFSFIFGWGFQIQARSVLARGLAFKAYYFRRIAGLAAIGLAHAIFVFSGDILVLYALLGALLWLCRDLNSSSLIKLALWMLPLSFFCLIVLAFIIDWGMTNDSLVVPSANPGLGGSFIDATMARLYDWPFTFAFLALLQGPLAFGAFALGLAAGKTDFFAFDSKGFAWLERHWKLILVLAIPLNVLYAAVIGGLVPQSYELTTLFGFILISLGAPGLSAVYLYLFTKLARSMAVPELFSLAGRNTLSVYIAQGVIAGFIFGGYGLGLFNALGLAILIPLSLLVALLSVSGVGLIVRFFSRGPLETLLRRISG